MAPAESAEKEKEIKEALNEALAEASGRLRLRSLALSHGGLLKDKWRQRAWPILLECDAKKKETADNDSGDAGTVCVWAEQVLLDVRRTLKRFPPGIDDDTRQDLQESLVSLICRLLKSHPDLNYYQGFHDMALTVLLVMREEDKAYDVVESLTLRHLTKFMKPTMAETSALLDYVMAVVRRENPNLYSFLLRSDVGTTFSLAWVITWFSHCLDEYETIVRIFDAFIAVGYGSAGGGTEDGAVFYPICVSAHLVLARARECMAGDCELSAQHAFLSRLPAHPGVVWDEALAKGRKLMCKYSLRHLRRDAERYRKHSKLRLQGLDETPGLWESIFCFIPFYDSDYHPSHWSPMYRVAVFGIVAAGLVAWYLRTQRFQLGPGPPLHTPEL